MRKSAPSYIYSGICVLCKFQVFVAKKEDRMSCEESRAEFANSLIQGYPMGFYSHVKNLSSYFTNLLNKPLMEFEKKHTGSKNNWATHNKF